MAESLKSVIERLKTQQQNSQTSNLPPAPKPIKPMASGKPMPMPQMENNIDDFEIPDYNDDMTSDSQNANPEQSVDTQSKNIDTNEQQILMEIEMLQNNGRYRAELLHQLQEINKALVVIAGVLVDLSGQNGQR